jgi:Domain of unknown function (DUF5655)/Domain of unknown function (DUF4287)
MVKRKSSSRAVAVKPAPKKPSVRPAPRGTRPSAAAGGSLYSVHPGVAMAQKWIAELAAKTGRSLDEWVQHMKRAGPKSEKECRAWLKEKYKLGTNTAWWLAEKSFGNPLGLAEDSPEGYLRLAPIYVEQMYAGPRAALKPIHDELIRLAQSLGDDVRICPCKTIVPLYRRHVFAEIKPATNKRIDLGFALGEEPFTSRLLDTGGAAKKNRITHRVTLTSLADIDLQVKRWLKQAYERDA